MGKGVDFQPGIPKEGYGGITVGMLGTSVCYRRCKSSGKTPGFPYHLPLVRGLAFLPGAACSVVGTGGTGRHSQRCSGWHSQLAESHCRALSCVSSKCHLPAWHRQLCSSSGGTSKFAWIETLARLWWLSRLPVSTPATADGDSHCNSGGPGGTAQNALLSQTLL